MEKCTSTLSLGTQEHVEKRYEKNKKHMYEYYTICILYGDLGTRQ